MPIKDLTKRRKYKHSWYIRNRERILTERKEYEIKNKEAIQIWRKQYYLDNKEYLNAQNRLNSKIHRSNNKEMYRDRDLRKKYNITLEEYKEIFNFQEGKCYLCELSEESTNQYGKKDLAVDHCHETGNIRGLACSRCNMGVLGSVKDDLDLLIKIVDNYKKVCEKQKQAVQFDPLRARFKG